MDELEQRINEPLAESVAGGGVALRSGPELDGNAVIDRLGVEPGRIVGEAMQLLMEIRLDEGLIGEGRRSAAGSMTGSPRGTDDH